VEATLHQLHLVAHYNHSCGFFARAGAIWSRQDNSGYTPARPGDDFWQFNLEAGYRFAQRRAELRVGLLNLTDQDYQLNPLNLAPFSPAEAERRWALCPLWLKKSD
jgi:outer membrane receptor protein involved in Fe transport